MTRSLPTDFGAAIRDGRKASKLDQAALAKRIGVSRQWVVEIELGHSRAERALVPGAIDALNLRLDASIGETNRRPKALDIDAIVAYAKKRTL